MTPVRARLRLVTTLAVLAALALLLPATPALANHNGRTLQVEPEVQSHRSGEPAELTAVLSESTGLLLGPTINVDFEIQSGPGDKDGSTPRTPDMTCDVGAPVLGATSCTVTYTATGRGTDIVRAWIDHDDNDETAEWDNDEGPNEGADPGAREPDVTDVVLVHWTQGPPSKLDCDDASGDDEATNVSSGPGSEERYRCKATDGGGVAMQGVVIDGENLNADGVNDPEQPGADYDNACTTGGDGACIATIPSFGAEGTANICFWTDLDGDNQFDPLAETEDGDPYHGDGGDCDGEKPDEPEANDLTDVVVITWVPEKVPPTSRITRPANGGTYRQSAFQQILGEATDLHSNVTRVQIVLRKVFVNGRCDLWNGSSFQRAPNCAAKRWNDATIDQGSDPQDVDWRYELTELLQRSDANWVKHYVVLARAFDSKGNVETRLVSGRNSNRFEITRG